MSLRWGGRRLQFPECHKDQPYNSDLQTQAALREFRSPLNKLPKHNETKKILRITAQKLKKEWLHFAASSHPAGEHFCAKSKLSSYREHPSLEREKGVGD